MVGVQHAGHRRSSSCEWRWSVARTDRHRHGFFTDVGMQGPHDFALAGLVFRLLLEEAERLFDAGEEPGEVVAQA